MAYIYETHLHTSVGSACGKSRGYEYIAKYKELGFAGIIVTDHFFNGNCAISNTLPWEERIAQFYEGFEEAREEGDKQHFQVFFSWECRFGGDEYLVYGLDKEWLLAHPDILEWDHITHYQKVKEAGGLVIQAHPFRERNYLTQIDLHPYQCDGWEVANAGNPPEQDILTHQYAKKHHMIMTAGSDLHDADQIGNGKQFGVAFDTPLTDISDFVKRIKNGEGNLYVPGDRLTWQEGSVNHLPIYFYNEKNEPELITDLNKLLR